MPKRSIHFTDETLETVKKVAELKGYNFNQACNWLLNKVGKRETWRLLRIEKLKLEQELLEDVESNTSR